MSAAILRNHADYPAVSHFRAPTQSLIKIEDQAILSLSLLFPVLSLFFLIYSHVYFYIGEPVFYDRDAT